MINIEFEDSKLNDLVKDFNVCYEKHKENFVHMAVCIYNIWSYCKNNYFICINKDYYNCYKLLDKFGFDRKQVCRYKQCYERFIQCVDGVYKLVDGLKEFSPSKLYELLVLSDDILYVELQANHINSNMTVKEIRDYIKTHIFNKVEENQKINKDDLEDNIPMVYDPKQKYEFSYFEKLSKQQLLNVVWELQKAYQKLKEKGVRNGKSKTITK